MRARRHLARSTRQISHEQKTNKSCTPRKSLLPVQAARRSGSIVLRTQGAGYEVPAANSRTNFNNRISGSACGSNSAHRPRAVIFQRRRAIERDERQQRKFSNPAIPYQPLCRSPMALHRPIPRRPHGCRHRRRRASPMSFTSASTTAASGRPTTPAAPGTRSSTASPPAPSARSPSRRRNPDIIYVGSGEGLQRPDLSTGDGIYKSTDGGKTWRHLGLRDGQQIPAIIVDPQDPNRVFVAVLGHPYGPNAERGVFRSTDGGADLAEGSLQR